MKPPRVTNMLQKLDKQSYVEYTRCRGVTLTPKGKRLADILHKRHSTLKTFFVRIGYSEATAEKDTCEIEHKIHPKSIEKLAEFLGFLNTFPNPAVA
jgi:DtxR family Mn-dependent transcriptional regulator